MHRPDEADWQEAIDLARAAGIDIDPETDDIYDVNSTGLTWVPDFHEVGECNAAYNRYFEDHYADFEQVYEPPIPYEGDLTDEEMEILRQWEEEQQSLWDERRRDAVDYMATVPGCEEYHACLAEQTAREAEIQAQERTAGIFADLERRAEAGEEISEEEWIAAEEASMAIWEEHNRWMEESGCQIILYGDYSEPAPEDIQQVTWDELGIIPPEHWEGSTHVDLLEDGEIRPLGERFSSPGWLMTMRSGATGFEVTFDETVYEPYPGSEGDFTPEYAVWSSPDGVDWTRSTTTEFDYGMQGGALPDGTSFSITWAEEDRSDLVRINPDGSSDRLLLSDLAGELDTEGYVIVGVDSGPYGVVAWASKWGDPPRFVEEEFEYDPNSMILYSPDGRGWGVTPTPGVDVADVIVGQSDVMIFLADPDNIGSDTPPHPVLLGTAG